MGCTCHDQQQYTFKALTPITATWLAHHARHRCPAAKVQDTIECTRLLLSKILVKVQGMPGSPCEQQGSTACSDPARAELLAAAGRRPHIRHIFRSLL